MSSPSSQKQLAILPSNPADHTPHVSIELPTISIDADGDLRLRVGSETEGGVQDFVVCSRTMGRSSPVWKVMLFGRFKERKPDEGEWVVSLLEKDPEALTTVLNIIHGRFASIPQKPSLEQLYFIMALTHKYDMVQKVQPWAASWSTRLCSRFETKKGGDVALLTFIAWELGQQQIFWTLVNDLVFDCSVDSEGRLTTPEGDCLDDYDHIGPDDLIGMSSPVSITSYS
jgi:hypothetical protein